jgi:hypothetical protein
VPDLFDPLRNLDDVPMSPLPASEVRRRGDRMRRRRHGLQALGTAAGVGVIASGAALAMTAFDNPTREDATSVAAAPEGGWLHEIPTHYALDRGYPDARPPESQQHGPSQKFAPLTVQGIKACGAVGYPSAEPVDSLGTLWNAPEDFRARELTIYPDATTASSVVTELADAWQACPTETLPDPPFELTTSVERGTVGDESWTVVKGAGSAPQLEVFNLVRVGNAVLVNQISNEGSFDSSAAHVAEQNAQVGALVADMCIFALDPCPDGPDNGPDISPKIPPLDENVLLTTRQLDELDGRGWEQIANREDPTLDCQADWLHNLGSEKGTFRE